MFGWHPEQPEPKTYQCRDPTERCAKRGQRIARPRAGVDSGEVANLKAQRNGEGRDLPGASGCDAARPNDEFRRRANRCHRDQAGHEPGNYVQHQKHPVHRKVGRECVKI